MSFFNPFIV